MTFKRHWVGGLAALLSTSAMATLAAAQEQPARAAGADEVVVTGSRIVRQDYRSDSPIVTVSEEAIRAAGPATMEAILNNMPQFAALRSGSSNSSGRGGRNNANLRGLGIGRTLTLLDGRRMQPSDLAGAVDLNTIPEALIENVEVITGGASATYGSDAVAGVVNFKLRRNFEGLLLDGQYGVSQYGDAGSYNLSAVAGGRFGDDRGSFIVGASYLDREGTPRGEREFFVHKTPSTLLSGGVIQSDATNLPAQSAINAVFARYGITGINVPRNAALGVNPDGTLFTAAATTTVPILNLKWGEPPYYIADGTRVAQPAGETTPLQQEQQKYSVLTKAEFDLDEWFSAYGQFLHVHYASSHTISTTGYREPTIPITNPFIPADLRAVLASRPNPNAPLIYFWGAKKIDDLLVTTDTYDVSQAVLGLRGRAPNLDWTWDVYASYGRTEDQTNRSPIGYRPNIEALLNAPDGGRSVCPGGFNPFSPTSLASDPATRACYNYVNRPTIATSNFTQKIAEASLQGTLFTLPAGDLKFAAGANYRENAFADYPPALAIQGLLIGTAAGDTYNRTGSDEITEFFGELLIPVLRDVPLIRELNVDVAGRTSNYASIGVVKTYKGSLDWAIVDPVRLRASYQRAIRAPNLGELFPTSGAGGVLLGQVAQGGGDPCDVASTFRRSAAAPQVRSLCLASGVPSSVIDLFQFSGGSVETFTPPGVALSEETADTVSFGVVLRSPFEQPLLSGMQLSVDAYDIRVADAIGTITGPVTINLCFNSNGASNPTYSADNVFCQQISRNAGGSIARILTPRLNLASYQTAGVDAQLDWTLPLSGFGLDEKWGSVGLNMVASYMRKYNIRNFAGDPVVNYAGSIGNAQVDAFSISHPEWRLQASATWNLDRFSGSLRARWIESMFDSLDASGTTRVRPGVPDKLYFDASAAWDVTDTLAVRGGVLNLTDTEPPFFNVSEATDVALYDILGRRYYVGVSKKF